MEAEDLSRAIDAVRAGDSKAFNDLLEPLVQPAYQLAYTMVRDRAEAEDVVQESALRAWRKFGQLRDGTSVRAWFLSIVANQARMWLRGRWSSVIKMADVERPESSSEDRLAESVDLQRALAVLPADDRTVLLLYFGLDLTMEEVGQILQLTTAGAKSRVYRAVGKLRPEMGADGGR